MVSFIPVADARVKSTSPSSNYGADDVLRVRTGSVVYDSYLKFDVTGLGGSPVVSAQLRLFVTDSSNDGGALYEVASNWTELGLTWNTAPGMAGTPLGNAGSATAGGWIEFDVASVVQSDGTYAFGLSSSSSNSVYYSSREGANPPQLVVETGGPTVPVAAFSGSPLSGWAPLAVSFTDLSTGPPTSWLWEFGDGATSTLENPTHTYSEGIYDITLTATNGVGSDATTTTQYVTVDALRHRQ